MYTEKDRITTLTEEERATLEKMIKSRSHQQILNDGNLRLTSLLWQIMVEHGKSLAFGLIYELQDS